MDAHALTTPTRRWGRTLVAVALPAWPSLACAAFLTVSSAGGFTSDVRHNLANSGTGSACAFSVTTFSGPNQVPSHVPAPTPAPPPACTFTDDKGIVRAGIGDLKIAKVVPDNDIWKSTTNLGTGGTSAEGFGQFRVFPDKTVSLRVTADVLIGAGPGADPTAAAAGYADDPMMFDAGSYDYSILLDPLLLDIGGLAGGNRAESGLELSATASFAGSHPLWLLRLGLDETGSFDLSFDSDAALGLDDSLVRSNLLAALQPSSGIGRQLLSPFTLFSTRFTAAQSFEFSEFARDHAQGAVAEPSPLGLLAGALAWLAWAKARPGARRRGREGAASV